MELKHLLLACMLMSSGLALSYDLRLDGEQVGDEVVVEPGSHTLEVESWSTNLTILNYSAHVSPRNLEHLARKFEVPLQNQVNQPVPDHFESGEQSFDVPDAICGNFHVWGTVYFEENGDLGRVDLEKRIEIPCKTRRARFLYFLFSTLPWPLVSLFLNAVGEA